MEINALSNQIKVISTIAVYTLDEVSDEVNDEVNETV